MKRFIHRFRLIILSLAVNSLDLSEGSGGSELLSAANFKIEARLKVIRKNSLTGLDEDSTVSEFYSNAAQRARLDIYGPDEDNSDPIEQMRYFYHHNNGKQQMLKLNLPGGVSTECLAADREELVADLFGSLSRLDKQIQAKDWLQVTDPAPNYVIGLTRLLLLAELNKVKQILVPNEEPLVRNERSVKYTLGLSGGRKMAIYYSKLHNHKLDLPLRIWMGLEGGGEIIVDYLSLEIFNQLDQYQLNGLAESEGGDLFSFPVGIGCAKHLEATNLLDGLMAPKVVSFRAKLNRMMFNGGTRPIKDSFVAYDGFMKVLRLDTVREEADDEYSISIYELITHRRYNIRQRVSESDGRRGNKLSAAGSGAQCASTRLFSEGALNNPFEPILPLNSLVEMGEATVRGVRARVFEQDCSWLPPMLFPRVTFVTVDGKTMSEFDPTVRGTASRQGEYTVTYYFAKLEDGKQSVRDETGDVGGGGNLLQLGPLMRIDVRELSPLYRVEIHDFVWQLAEAPNGDRQDELFSLQDRCSTGTGGDENSYAKLSIDLEFSGDDRAASYSSTEATRMLESPITRNKALIRALCDVCDQIQPTQMHNIETKMNLLSQSKKLMLRLSARLGRQELKLYEALSIGTGLPGPMVQPTGAVDFDQCFWEAVHRRRPGQELIFSYCYVVCFIDDNPNMDYSAGKLGTVASSSVFNPLKVGTGKGHQCQIFKLQLLPDPLADKIPSRSIHNKLRGTTMVLPLIGTFGGSKALESLTFRVKQVELSNEKRTASLRNSKGQLESEEQLLEGLGLSPSVAKLIKAPSELQQQKASQQQTIVARMSYEMCQSSCMANISCHSFSICASGQQLECLVSDLEFRDANVFGQISSKLAKLSYLERKRGTLSIDLPIDNQAGEDKDNEPPSTTTATSTASKPSFRTIELRVDKKCRIYNKYATEMFRLTERVLIRPQNKYLIGADDEEQCASLCLKTNVKFFKRMANMRLKMLKRAKEADSGDDYMNELLEKQNTNMKSWCGSFRYLNLATSIEPYDLRDFVDPDKLTRNGLCLLMRARKNRENGETKPPSREDGALSKGKAPKLVVDNYEFVYSMLYEKQYGVQIEAGVYLKAGSGFGQLKNNQLVSASADEESCARACFLQTTGLEPYCRSFEFVFETGQSSPYCIFNSITLLEARQRASEMEGATGEQFELPGVKRVRREGVETWHFEPRSSYTLDHLVLANLMASNSDADSLNDPEPAGLGTFAILLVVVVSLIGGLIGGLKIGARLSKQIGDGTRRESIENPSRSFLSSLVGADVSHRRFEPDLDLPDLAQTSGWRDVN